MSKAINTIARSIEAGALKTGASQYLEAIEAAQKQLANNQILLISSSKDEIVKTGELSTKATLYTFTEDVEDFQGVTDEEIMEAYLPNTIKIIYPGAFAYKTKMTKVTMPSSLKEIADSAFLGDINLQEDIVLPEGLETIAQEAFAGAGATKGIAIYIPQSVTSIGVNAFAEVAHIYYNGTATGAPWGALAMN